MKAKEIRTKSDKELQTFIDDQRKALVNAHIDLRTKEVKNVKAIFAIRRDLARALTVKRSKELELDQKKEAKDE